MEPYILLVYLKLGYSGGPAFYEFRNQSACERAAESIQKKWGDNLWGEPPFTICLNKEYGFASHTGEQ